jgi:hypothetical protein
VSADLEEARALAGGGNHKKAVGKLWAVEAQARGGNIGAARGLLELATELRDQLPRRLRSDCDLLIESARASIQRGGPVGH